MNVRLTSCLATVSLAILLTSCAAGGSESPEAQAPQPEPPDQGLSIANQKNATATDPCELLPPDSASQLGVEPEGDIDSKLNPDSPTTCTWESQDGQLTVSLTPVDGRSLQAYYDTKNQFKTYEELDISGHPAVVAVEDDAMAVGSCTVWLASGQNQVVGSTNFLPSDDVGTVDPCDVAKKTFELSVPSWPAA